MVLIPEAKYNGNYSSPYVYHHSNVKTINVFCNGKQLTDNQFMTDMDLADFDSFHCHFLYRQFVKLLCRDGYPTVSYSQWYLSLFVYTFDLTHCPINLVDNPNDSCDLRTSGSLDLNLIFNAEMTENYIVEICAHSFATVNFDASGNVIEQ